jgi:hypothetical protein
MFRTTFLMTIMLCYVNVKALPHLTPVASTTPKCIHYIDKVNTNDDIQTQATQIQDEGNKLERTMHVQGKKLVEKNDEEDSKVDNKVVGTIRAVSGIVIGSAFTLLCRYIYLHFFHIPLKLIQNSLLNHIHPYFILQSINMI